MPDPRFFSKAPAIDLATLCEKTGAQLFNNRDAKKIIDDVAPIDNASEAHVTFFDNVKYRDQLKLSKAGACFMHPDNVESAPQHAACLLSSNPYRSYALAAQIFYPSPKPKEYRAKSAFIHPSAKIGSNCSIADFVMIGEGVEIGNSCIIKSHVSISDNVKIGSNVRIGSHTSLSFAHIGDDVRIYSGCQIGQDGFGFAIDPNGFVKVPQLGRVIIEGHSEIGANTTIDRGALNDTVIGMGTWIDNLVQIAHNVKIGRGCILAAQVGIAGSTELGNYVMVGGQVGISGHLKIGDGARIAAKSGVTRNIPSKEEWMGYPAQPMKQFLRQVASLSRSIKKDQ